MATPRAPYRVPGRVARNEEFSEIATVLKKKPVICEGGGPAGKMSR